MRAQDLHFLELCSQVRGFSCLGKMFISSVEGSCRQLIKVDLLDG